MDDEQNGYPSYPSRSLYRKPARKVCQFFRDGDQHFPGIKLVVNSRSYQTIENLQNDLSKKVSGLPFGVRSIYTPRGRDAISTLDQLEDNGNYVCSTYLSKAKGVDVAHVQQYKLWHTGGKPQSGKRAYSRLLQDTAPKSPPRKAWHGGENTSSFASPMLRQPKKITVLRDDAREEKHVILLNRRMTQSFEDVLGDIRGIFQTPITHMFTLGGKPVSHISSLSHVAYYRPCMCNIMPVAKAKA